MQRTEMTKRESPETKRRKKFMYEPVARDMSKIYWKLLATLPEFPPFVIMRNCRTRTAGTWHTSALTETCFIT